MQTMTLEQLRAARSAGGVVDVTLKGQGGAFLVQISTRSGSEVVLAKARSTEPRQFGNPAAALSVLRDIGITVGRFDAADWNPVEKKEISGNSGRAEAMRQAHRAAAYSHWLAEEIQAAINDPRPGMPHEQVMAGMDAEIAAIAAERKPTDRPARTKAE